MPISIRFAVPDLPPELQDVALKIRAESVRAASEGAVMLRGRMVEASPVGGTALLRNSWEVDPPLAEAKAVTAGTRTTAVQAIIVDEGARPHFPPPRALSQWVRRKLGIVEPQDLRRTSFRIGRAIKRRGLPARRVLSRAFEAARPEIDRIFDQMQARVAQALGGI